MSSYRGPHASVTQQFVTSPGAVAVESLPPAIVGTAYDVYDKEVVGESFGIINRTMPWVGENKVVHDESVAGERAYNFYPVKVYADTEFGDIELTDADATVSVDGVEIPASINPAAAQVSYALPGANVAVGNCEAVMPYYKWEPSEGSITITNAGGLNVVNIAGGAIASSGVRPGQSVFIKRVIDTDDGPADVYTYVGIVGLKPTLESVLKLRTPYIKEIAGTGIIVGISITKTDGYMCEIGKEVPASELNIDIPDTIYDPNANFSSARVKIGDFVRFSALAFSDSIATPVEASIVSIIDANTIKVNTYNLSADHDQSIKLFYALISAAERTVAIRSYSIQRFVGFSENRLYKNLNAMVGIKIDEVNLATGLFSIATDEVDEAEPEVGDIVMIGVANSQDITYPRPYRVTSVTVSSDKIYVTVDVDGSGFGGLYRSDVEPDTEVEKDNFLNVWKPVVKSSIKADYRAIRSEEAGVAKRIGSVADIFTAFVKSGDESILPWNELAYMCLIAFQKSGGKVLYAVSASSDSDEIVTSYSEALEALKIIDCYSHAIGTTAPGVNAMLAPYCNDQSDPYEGHERIAILTYDELDVLLMCADTGTISAVGVISLLGGQADPIASGVTVNDTVRVYKDGKYQFTATVTETPVSSTSVQTNYSGDAVTGCDFKFMSGRKDDQAIRISGIGAGDRRITAVWPGWFYANYGDVRTQMPPYFISAANAGMDSGILVSQSFTNMDYDIVGISNISLNTSTKFKKAQLDVIGGGGVDIMIQDSATSQFIKSRHDLTTNMDAVQYRERSITKQADLAAKTLRTAVSPYVGRFNITDSLFAFLGSICTSVSTTLTKKSILREFNVTSIKRDEVIDDKINFYVEALVFIAGNYYDITMLVRSR